MSQTGSIPYRVYLTIGAVGAVAVMQACTPDPSSAPAQSATQNEPYRLVENWAQLPDGLVWGQAIAVEVDADGNLIVFHRCSSDTCVGQSEPPLLKFDPNGELLMSWGEGMLVWPHGLNLDSRGNIWVTDGRHEGDMGEVIHKFSPEGELLMTIGTPGVAGDGPYTFDGVSDVVVADSGDIFVADGHINNRVVKYSADGQFLMAWGQAGTGPGEFNMPHSIDIDSQGRVFVADRGNNRVQIFDQEGRYLDEWTQFGRPSGVFISEDDRLFVADSQSVDGVNPEFEMGIYYGSAVDGSVEGYIGDILTESVTEDPNGVLYSGLVANRGLVRYEPE
jgi:sugar lactone lactonase YvrE